MIRIGAYFSPLHGLRSPTGVTKHCLGMLRGLSDLPGVQLQLIAAPDAYKIEKAGLGPALARLPVAFHRGSEKSLRRANTLSLARPLDDAVTGGLDWVYCPKEQVANLRRAKLAVTVHDVLALEPSIAGLPPKSLRTRLAWKLLMYQILSKADLILTVSQFTRDRLMALCSVDNPERIRVVGNAAHALFFESPTHDARGTTPRVEVAHPYVLAVGGLNWRKGGDIILQLGQLLLNSKSELKIMVCGLSHDADLASRLKALHSQHPRFPVELCGYVSDEELAKLYRDSLALAFPSRYEGFGIPIIEAMASGIPVICSNHAGVAEAAGDKAIIVESNSAPSYLEAIKTLQASASIRRAQVEAARAHASNFTWKECASRMVGFMREISGSC